MTRLALALVLSLGLFAAAPAGALTVENNCGTASDPSNPGTATIGGCSIDGGSFGDVTLFAESTATDTDFLVLEFLLTNPSANVLGDGPEAFLDFSHPTQLTELSGFEFDARGILVRLEEPGASLSVDVQGTVNGSPVSGATASFVYDESVCTVGTFCSAGTLETVSVSETGVSTMGNRWTALADGAMTVTVVPEPSTALLLAGGLTGLAIRRRGA